MTAMALTVSPGPVRPADPCFPADPFFPADAARTSPQFARRVRLSAEPGSAAMARAEVAAAIRAWGIDVDPDVALLLTSELVTNAVTHGAAARDPRDADPGDPAGQVILAITADAAGLRVDVHDGSADPPVLTMAALDTGGADQESGRGLLLVTSLSAEWGCYPTPAGKAVYFTLDAKPADVCPP
jgi:anti-sigma regulatory factor (Ser/Thr protein kinase)